MWKVPLFDLNYDERETKAALSVLKSGWLTMGPMTSEFEERFSAYLGGGVYSTGVSSCTAALHMALLACGIKEGDEVIIPGLTFVACLNVTGLVGAKPVLADARSLYDWNISAKDLKRKIAPRTKAIIIVHFAGYPCDMDEIGKIAADNGLLLIEDTAHAVGAEYKGIKCGTLGDIGCFSFFSNKNLSTGEGGMIVTKNKALHEKFRLLRSHGMTSMTVERHNKKAISYDVLMPGLNYRIDEVRSAIGIEQLKKLDKSNVRRKKLADIYRAELCDVKGLIIPWEQKPMDRVSSFHINPVLLPDGADRTEVIERLKEKGIQTSIHYPSFRQFTGYKGLLKNELKVADRISDRVLTLPLFPKMSFKDVRYVSRELKRCLYEKN